MEVSSRSTPLFCAPNRFLLVEASVSIRTFSRRLPGENLVPTYRKSRQGSSPVRSNLAMKLRQRRRLHAAGLPATKTLHDRRGILMTPLSCSDYKRPHVSLRHHAGATDEFFVLKNQSSGRPEHDEAAVPYVSLLRRSACKAPNPYTHKDTVARRTTHRVDPFEPLRTD